MQCRTCGYALWQLRVRECPECGTPFKPSEFEFLCNAVRFCCPHCDQAYYGTGPNGHLDPASFTCVGCQTPVTMDEMVMLPAAGLSAEQTLVRATPWANRRGRSWFIAFFQTFSMAISNPNAAIEGVPETSSLKRAATYAGIHLFLQTFVGSGFVVFIMVAVLGAVGGMNRGLGFVGGTLLAAFGVALLVTLWIAAAHAVLRLTGDTPFGIRRTAHAFLYSAGNNFLTAIPCVGFYFSWLGVIWWSISAGFMLAKAQRVTGGRAALAVTIPLIVAVAVVGGLGAVGAMILGARTTAMMNAAGAPGTPLASANGLAMMLPPAGQRPTHAAWLIVDGTIYADDFLLPPPMSASTSQTSTIAGQPLSWYVNALQAFGDSQAEGGAALNPAALLQFAGGPPAAHRVGDYVFTYEGVPADRDDLWIAIAWPDPATNVASAAVQGWPEVLVISNDGLVTEIPTQDFARQLEMQNVARAALNLPRIPHPNNVTALPPPASAEEPAKDAAPAPDDQDTPAP